MLGSGRFLLNSEVIPKVFPPVRLCYSATKESDLGVVIPKRIERGPTDILKALASTVKPDLTAFPYKYPDDPKFYPYTSQNKRIYALALESGRKSARWIVEKNPKFFRHQLSEPPIQDFLQKAVYDENSELSVETLLEVIHKRSVLDAINVFNLLKNKNIDVPDDVKQSLLELVCFYNATEKLDVKDVEYKWFENFEMKTMEINTWKANGFADTLFKSLNPNCPLANSAMIQGMIKYNNVKKAFELYKNAKRNNVKLSIGVYNAILTQASNTNVEIPDGLKFIQNVFQEMSSKGLKPNLGTLNSTLKALMNMRHHKNETFLKKLLMEFAILKIPPSLGSFFYIFRILAQTRGRFIKNRDLIIEFLQVIENNNYEVIDESDLHFFPYTMNLFSALGGDYELSQQLNKILFKNDNLKFIANSQAESLYFRDYFHILFKMEPIEIAMEKYKEIVPTVYSPEFSLFALILKTIIENNHSEYLVEFWNDMKKYRMSRFLMLLSLILSSAKNFKDEKSIEVIHDVAVTALEYISGENTARFNGNDVSRILSAFLITGDFEKAVEVFHFAKNKEDLSYQLEEQSVLELLQHALTAENVPVIMDCMKLASQEYYVDVIEEAEKALPLLSGNDKIFVSKLVEKFRRNPKKEEKPEEETETNGENEEKF